MSALPAGPWAAVIAVAVLMLAAALWLRRRSRVTPFPREDLPDYPEPGSFPAIGSRGGTAPMDAVGAEVDQMLNGEDRRGC